MYKILIGERFYIGSTNDVVERLRDHLRELKRNNHHNPRMQHVFNQYKKFDFVLLEETDHTKLAEKEQTYLDQYFNDLYCLNTVSKVNNPHRTKSKVKKHKVISKEELRKTVLAPIKSPRKPIKLYDNKTRKYLTFESHTQAAKALDTSVQALYQLYFARRNNKTLKKKRYSLQPLNI